MRKIMIQLFLLAAVAAYGNTTIDDVFRTMPAQFLPGFHDQHREALLLSDNRPVSYPLGEITKLHHTDNFLEIRTSAVGTMQIKMLPIRRASLLPARRNSFIISVIQTVCGSACDSHISFFDTRWQPLDTHTLLPDISAAIFMDSVQKEAGNEKYILSLSGISPISAQFSGKNNSLVLTFNYRQHLSPGMIEELTPFLETDTVVLQWHNGRFQ